MLAQVFPKLCPLAVYIADNRAKNADAAAARAADSAASPASFFSAEDGARAAEERLLQSARRQAVRAPASPQSMLLSVLQSVLRSSVLRSSVLWPSLLLDIGQRTTGRPARGQRASDSGQWIAESGQRTAGGEASCATPSEPSAAAAAAASQRPAPALSL